MVLHELCYVVMHNATLSYVDMPFRYRTIRYVNLCHITLCFMHQLKQVDRRNRMSLQVFKVARYSFSRSIPPTFERKLRHHKQRFGKIDTTVVLAKDEKLL